MANQTADSIMVILICAKSFKVNNIFFVEKKYVHPVMDIYISSKTIELCINIKQHSIIHLNNINSSFMTSYLLAYVE